ncbi:citrate/2-methylcitrate synthase [Kosakonia sacchari]|uniref:citrate/2-methylcitrate synthase n=1 Tax=Kosakonia sacchari TaxID=1158459 RepID=UPI0032D99317
MNEKIKVLDALIISTLKISPEQLCDELTYQSVHQWDSLCHVELILELEKKFSCKISSEQILELISVKALRSFVSSLYEEQDEAPGINKPISSVNTANVFRGLNGIAFDHSAITYIDGSRGILTYRGYSIHQLAKWSSFEEVSWLLLHGELPNAEELTLFRKELSEGRDVPKEVLDIMVALRNASPTEALRTGVSALASYDTNKDEHSTEHHRRTGMRLLAQIPILIAAHHAARQERQLVLPDPDLPFVEHFLWMLRGQAPLEKEIELMNCDFVIHADHSSNASTFSARVATGCQVDMYGVFTAAISTFAGDLHGGAIEKVMEMLDEIGEPENTPLYVQERRAQNKPIMGFGHRVYRTEDPRVRHLRDAAWQASQLSGDLRYFKIIQALELEMKPYARHGIDANVDLYAGLLYRLLNLPNDLSIPIFIAARVSGWIAHALEQRENNVLIRPLLHYIGKAERNHPKTL